LEQEDFTLSPPEEKKITTFGKQNTFHVPHKDKLLEEKTLKFHLGKMGRMAEKRERKAIFDKGLGPLAR